jgi:iron complex transport system ATP-binding protein
MAIADLTEVCFYRDKRPILHNVSWRIELGTHWALLGANGSGKTTLLKIITGYEWPTSGRVEVLGQLYGACDLRDVRPRIGWVSSSLEHRLPALDTALEVVASGLDASIGVYRELETGEAERARLALDQVGGAKIGSSAYGTLSQGEQQRVLIARALVARPELLILDEPCAGLDPAARAQFLDDLGTLASAHDAPTMILVTHHIEEIGPWLSRVQILRQGCVAASGTPEAVLRSEILSEAFDCDCHVERIAGRYWLRAQRYQDIRT